MAIDYGKVVSSAFNEVGPRNPLRKLNDSDKRVLVAMLDVYRMFSGCGEFSSRFEGAADIAAQAAVLGRRIQSELLEGQLDKVLAPFLGDIRHLPTELESLSTNLKAILNNFVGKQGHMGDTMKNQFLLTASEFVHFKTGKYYDEHVAELLQALGSDGELGRDFSGDAIHKKRKYLKKNYPLLYAAAARQARLVGTNVAKRTTSAQ